MDTAPTLGGRNVSRLTLWQPNVAETTRLYVDGHLHAQFGSWRKHSHFQARESHPVLSVDLSGSAPNDDDVGPRPRWHTPRSNFRHLSRNRGAQSFLRVTDRDATL